MFSIGPRAARRLCATARLSLCAVLLATALATPAAAQPPSARPPPGPGREGRALTGSAWVRPGAQAARPARPAQAPLAQPPEGGDAEDGPLAPLTATEDEIRDLLGVTSPSLTLGWSSTEVDSTRALALADVDGDGDLDLAVGNDGQPIRLYSNGGAALETTASWSAAEARTTLGLAWGDVDGDGDLDLAVANNGQPNQLYINEGGQLTRSAWAPPAGSSTSVAWADFDRDGDLDLTVGSGAWYAQIYRNEGGALPDEPTIEAPQIFETTSIAWGDYDNDGDPDLLLGNRSAPSVVYVNLAGQLRQLVWAIPAAPVTTVAWVDWDNDGDLDVAMGTTEGLRIYTTDPYGAVRATPAWSTDRFESATAMAWGDVDGDGRLDMVAGEPKTELRLYAQAGGWQQRWASPETHNVRAAVWGDIDGDGDLDVVLGTDGQPNRIYSNDVGVLSRTTPDFTTARQYRSGAWGDLDGDGDLDLALTLFDRDDQGTLGTMLQGELYRNDGGRLALDPSWAPQDDPAQVAWGDVDGDRDLDLAVVRDGQPSQLYRNEGGRLVLDPAWAPTAAKSTSLAWGDLDGDGDLDLAIANYDAPSQLYRNEGGRLVLDPAWAPTAAKSTSLAWGDVDADGDLDLAVGNEGQRSQLYRNDRGSLRLDGWQPEAAATAAVAWGDYDGDGDLDLADANNGQPNRLYENVAGRLGQGPAWTSVEADDSFGLAWGDYDGDGDLDLAAANELAPHRLYRNDRGRLVTRSVWAPNSAGYARQLAWGDYDGDGDLDLARGEQIYLNGLDARVSPMPAPTVRIGRVGSTPQAGLFSSAEVLADPVIPISYSLFHPRDLPARAVVGEYSLDGGGSWLAAAAAPGTPMAGLATSAPAGATSGAVETPEPIPDGAPGIPGLVVSAMSFDTDAIVADIDVAVEVEHTFVRDLTLFLESPSGERVRLIDEQGGDGDDLRGTVFDDEAGASIDGAAAPFTGRFRPEQRLATFEGQPLRGTWLLTALDFGPGDTGVLRSWRMEVTLKSGAAHVFNWDTFGSGIVGQSDNVVFRLRALPALPADQEPAAAPRWYGGFAGASLPFRVRGTRVRVQRPDGSPVAGALVYRLPAGQSQGALPLRDAAGAPFRTDAAGFLQGRSVLKIGRPGDPGDELAALAPQTVTDTLTLYHTSAAPTAAGLQMSQVTAQGVQRLTVTADNPLLVFNLDVALEWDARKDARFMARLQQDLQRTSALLYDWTDGQVALGRVSIFHDARRARYEGGWDLWSDAHVRVYATNRLRPNANTGGVVVEPRADPDDPDELYQPGQVRMGAVWNRFGAADGVLGEDWPRTLAHELGHYLLFLEDNYLGLDDAGLLIPVDGCRGAMSDPYRDDYSELHPRDAEWEARCAATLSEREAGRADWETIRALYPEAGLRAPPSFDANPGPSRQPLAVTQVEVAPLAAPQAALDVPIFSLEQGGGPAQPGSRARAFLFQGDSLIDLGRPVLDRVEARGAGVGDRLCLFELSAGRLGCERIRAGDQTLALSEVGDWAPEVVVTPETSRTLRLEVRNLAPGMQLAARLYPVDAPAGAGIGLAIRPDGVYAGVFGPDQLPEPVFEGLVHVAAAGLEGREVVVDYALGGNPGRRWSRGAPRANPGRRWSRGAPVVSSDGQVILYSDKAFEEGQFYAFQTASLVPAPPSWARPVGQAYRLTATDRAPLLAGSSLSFGYLQREVPDGEEEGLSIYYWDGRAWEALPTALRRDYNLASAPVRGEGLYALMSSVPLSLRGAGWNLFRYPIRGEPRPVAAALGGIAGRYRAVYHYGGAAGRPWKLYAPGAPAYVNSLDALAFDQDYYIWVDRAVTIPFRGAATAGLDSTHPAPPATYYGPVMASVDFTPSGGLPVFARVNGVTCGSGVVQEYRGGLVYVVSVEADGPAGAPGCGAFGRQVTFQVGDRLMATRRGWDNNGVWRVPLGTLATADDLWRVRLPLVRR